MSHKSEEQDQDHRMAVVMGQMMVGGVNEIAYFAQGRANLGWYRGDRRI